MMRCGGWSWCTLLAAMLLATVSCDTAESAAPEGGAAAGAAEQSAQPKQVIAPKGPSDGIAGVSMVRTADGTLHALAGLEVEGSQPSAHYLVSRDGGANWSQPQRIGHAPDIQVGDGMLMLIADGGQRVYAIWKETTAANGGAVNPAGIFPGTLRYRVLSGESWSETMSVGTEDGVHGWFAATDRAGQLHLAWLESSVPQFRSIATGLFRRTTLDGTTAAEPVTVRDVSSSTPGKSTMETIHTTYQGLSGYVADDGGLRMVSVRKRDAFGDKPTLVYFDGSTERDLMRVDQINLGFQSIPPRLLRDAAGAEHLIVHALAGESLVEPLAARDYPALLDFSPATGQPVELWKPQARGRGEGLIDYQISRDAAGGLVILVQAEDAPAGQTVVRDLLMIVEGDGGWSAPRNVTGNAERQSAVAQTNAGPDRRVSGMTVYSAREAAAAGGGEGKVCVLMNNKEITYLMSEKLQDVPGMGMTNVWSIGSASTPMLSFVKVR